jgi:hypothetical protein
MESYLLNDSLISLRDFHRKYTTHTVNKFLLFLLILISTVNFYKIYNLFYQKKGVVDFSVILKKEGNTQFHLDDNNASENLYIYLKNNISDNISHIFIFKNPDSFYLSCVYYNNKLNQNKTSNISFTDDYSFEFILGKIREKCH